MIIKKGLRFSHNLRVSDTLSPVERSDSGLYPFDLPCLRFDALPYRLFDDPIAGSLHGGGKRRYFADESCVCTNVIVVSAIILSRWLQCARQEQSALFGLDPVFQIIGVAM
jgi:hypothetical protein